MTALAEVQRLFANVEETASSTYGTNELEPQLVKVLEFASSRPDVRSELAQSFLLLLASSETALPLGQPGAVEVLEFCMHELRWPEVRAGLIALMVSAADPRVTREAQRVLEAFNDDWPTGEIYERYRR